MEDASDILGGQLNVAQQEIAQPWVYLAFLDLLFYVVLTVSLGLAFYFLQPYYAQLRDRRYRKNLRRRHGIPDHDRRPFNLAFAAAKKANSSRNLKETTPSTANIATSSGSQSTILQRNAMKQRQNVGGSFVAQHNGNEATMAPLRGPSYVDSHRTSGNMTTAGEGDYYPGSNAQTNLEGPSTIQPSQPANRLPVQTRSHVEGPVARSKHGLEDGDEFEKEAKKTRVEGDEFIDGDEDAEWHDSDVNMDMDADEASPTPLARGSKRIAEGDSDEGFESSRGARKDKRARKNLKGKESNFGGHTSSETSRGKKRDRTEASSGAGGDDLVVDDEDDGHSRATRRRRVTSNPKASKKTSHSLSRKRGRETSSPGSDGSDSPSRRAARHKRGKRVVQASTTTDEDGDTVSTDPLCLGRRIGEEWHVGNVWYKVGPNGQRLRRANVKSRQPAFHMPNDSVHPDRNVNYEIFVQEWLTEEEYRLARDQQEVFEPEISRPSSLSDLNSPSEASSSTSTKGKNLLYASTSAKDVLALNGRNPKQSLISTNGTRVNPTNGLRIRRISTIQTIGPVEVDDASLRATRTFSKWEKQEREAQSLAYLSELAKKEEAAQAAKKVGSAASTAALTPSIGSGATSAQPTIAATSSVSTTPSSLFPLAKPAAPVNPTPEVAKASTSNLPSLTIPSAPAQVEVSRPPLAPFPMPAAAPQATEQPKPAMPAFAPPPPASNSFSFAKPTETKLAAVAPPSAPSAPAPSTFSFAKPSENQTAATAATQQPPANTSHFFAKPSDPAPPVAPVAAAPSSFTMPPPQNTAPAANQAAKAPFSFGFPGTSTSSVQAVAPAKSEPQTAGSGGGTSLISRLGGFGSTASQTAANMTPAPSAAPAPTLANPFAAPSAPEKSAPVNFSFGPGSSAPPSSTPTAGAPLKFSFNSGPTPAAAIEASKPPATFSFGSSTQPSNAAPAVPTTTAQQPKFTFGTGPSKPVTFPAPSSAQQASGTSGPAPTFNMPVANAQNTSTSMFNAPAQPGAGVSASNAMASNTAGPTFPAPNGAPKFSFGQGNAFTTPSKPTTSTSSSNPFAASTTPAGTPGGPAIFGAQTPLPAPSFGTASTTPAGKPPASSIFGSNTAFGQGTTTPAGTPAQAQGGSKPIFSFAPPAGSTTPAGPPPGSQSKFSFGFGNAATTSGGPGGASSTPVFGSGQPTPSAFGFGAPPTFSFGKPANSDTTQK